MERTTSFGYWLRRRRKALDLTQDELARQVGCAVGTIKKIESDQRRPSRQFAERLADMLRFTSDERTAFLKAARAESTVDQMEIAASPINTPDRVSAPVNRVLSGTITFLFTDIEGSTRLWEQHPQTMQAALAQHDALLTRIITAQGGARVKGTGDGMHAAFARATDALAAALTAQRALATAAWGATGPLHVRMALHTGVSEERDGDYFGPVLNRAARLLAVGHGGQILLTLATMELVREQLPEDTTLRDLGIHQLKDLSRPEQIFQLVAPDLPTDFPQLNTLNIRRTNLPAQLTALIGRAAEVADVCARLRRPEVRLLTLTGPGGTGKTRLGLQVAAALLEDFAHGVYFVNLAAINDPNLIASTILQTFGITETRDQVAQEQLRAYLSEKQVLLLLDNFEQIVDAAPTLVAVLAGCPQLKVLVTSRVPLHLRGEHEIAVSPLALPDLQRLPARDQLTQYAAVELFIQRALEVQPTFAVTNTNAPAVAEICARLDGLPLAIELAAARSRLFAPQALLARLIASGSLPTLTGGGRDLPARQQTIRATIEWSYRLLDAADQTLFARLGIFSGGWNIAAAEVVCNIEGVDVTPLIESLVAQNLVQVRSDQHEEMRFILLETIREYALERLAAQGELDVLQQKHAAYFLALAEAAEPRLRSSEQMEWIDKLGTEYSNLRAALEWGFSSISQAARATLHPAAINSNQGYQIPDYGIQTECGLRLAGALWYYWLLRGDFNEWQRWAAVSEAAVERGLRLADSGTASGHQLSSSVAQVGVQALIGAAQCAGWTEEVSRVVLLRDQSIMLARQAADPRLLAHSLVLAGQTLLVTSNAIEIYQEGLALARASGDSWLIAKALENLAWQNYRQSHPTAAIAHAEEGLSLARALGDRWLMQRLLFFLGCFYAWGLGEYATARTMQEENLALARAAGNRLGIAYALAGLGEIAKLQGDNTAARQIHTERLMIERALGKQEGAAHALWTLAIIATDQSDYLEAHAMLAESLAFYRKQGEPPFLSHVLSTGAWGAFEQGNYHLAMRDLEEGLALARSIGDTITIARMLLNQSSVALAQGNLTAAEMLVHEARTSIQALPLETDIYKCMLAAVLEMWGCLVQRQGQFVLAIEHQRASLEILRALHPPPSVADSMLHLGLALLAGTDLTAAQTHLVGALAIYQIRGARQRIAWTLEGCAGVAAAQGQPERAARLWGAAATLRAAIGAPMWPVDRSTYEQRVATARAQLLPEAFDAAWAAGAALTLEQAVAYALGTDDEDAVS